LYRNIFNEGVKGGMFRNPIVAGKFFSSNKSLGHRGLISVQCAPRPAFSCFECVGLVRQLITGDNLGVP
jgi:hypothetical protein